MSTGAANEVELDGVRVVVSMSDSEVDSDTSNGRLPLNQREDVKEPQVDIENRDKEEEEEDLLDYDNVEEVSGSAGGIEEDINNNNNSNNNFTINGEEEKAKEGEQQEEGVYDTYKISDSTKPNDIDHTNSRQFLEEQAQEAARQLLREDAPKIVVNYKAVKFLLFFYTDKGSSSTTSAAPASYPVICEDTDLLHSPCADVMARIRYFLENLYGKLEFATKEILFRIPVLDLEICEDNVFNSQVTIRDIQTIFHILRDRSLKAGEKDIPEYIEANIEFRLRFVSRFNALVELTEGSATLANILPFSNDEDNPVVLDDPATPDSEPEVVIMDLDDDDNSNGNDKVEDGQRNVIGMGEVGPEGSDIEIDLDDENDLSPQKVPEADPEAEMEAETESAAVNQMGNQVSVRDDIPAMAQNKEDNDSEELLEIDSDDGMAETT